MRRVSLGLVLCLSLGCNGSGSQEETSEWDDSWVVGPVFEGYYGLTKGEISSVNSFILHEDGSVEWGSTFSCEPNPNMAFGTWTQTAADEIEIRSSEASWPGNPGLEFIRLKQTDECSSLVVSEVQTDGSLTTKGEHPYSRGVPCLSDCDGFGEREIIECEGEVNPCD